METNAAQRGPQHVRTSRSGVCLADRSALEYAPKEASNILFLFLTVLLFPQRGLMFLNLGHTCQPPPPSPSLSLLQFQDWEAVWGWSNPLCRLARLSSHGPRCAALKNSLHFPGPQFPHLQKDRIGEGEVSDHNVSCLINNIN